MNPPRVQSRHLEEISHHVAEGATPSCRSTGDCYRWRHLADVPDATPIEIWFADEARIGQENGLVAVPYEDERIVEAYKKTFRAR